MATRQSVSSAKSKLTESSDQPIIVNFSDAHSIVSRWGDEDKGRRTAAGKSQSILSMPTEYGALAGVFKEILIGNQVLILL